MKNQILINKLVETIREQSQKYYTDGSSDISDTEFDSLVEELKNLDPDNEILKKTGWGYDPNKVSTSRRKIKHKYGGMSSINRKPRSIENIPNNLRDMVRISPKLDGLSGSAWFIDGQLVMGVTRGDGNIGIYKTDKMAVILENQGATIPEGFTGAIRGEFVISENNWLKMKTLGLVNDDNDNRNTVAGIINKNELSDDLRYVQFNVYKVLADENNIVGENIIDVTLFLKNFGCSADYRLHINSDGYNQEYLENLYEEWQKEYPCDGLVITSYNVKKSQDGIYEYDEVAYKFDSEEKDSKVIGVDWSMSRTNKYVPTVMIEPIKLSGATIKRATGFNAKYIFDNKIDVGAVVRISRSGQVIPDIQKVVFEAPEFSIPTVCPICGCDLEWSGVDLVCVNEDCGNRDYRDLQSWIANIGRVDGIGDTLKFKFLEEIEVYSIEDLYKYNPENWDDKGQSQRRLFKKVLDKLFNEKVDPVDAMCALNIKRLGRTSATKILQCGDMYSNFFDPQYKDKVTKLLGPATSESIFTNGEKVDRLEYLGNRVDWNISNDIPNSDELVKVCITGKLSMKRSDFEEILKKNGYINAPIGKDTFVLITDSPFSGSSKNKKADQLGIKKMTEADFTAEYIK